LCACPASTCLPERTKPEGTAMKPTTMISPTSERAARDHALSGQDLIDRLKESKEHYLLEIMADGRSSGRRWAEREASYRELLRISNICLGSPEDDLEGLDNAVKPDPSIASRWRWKSCSSTMTWKPSSWLLSSQAHKMSSMWRMSFWSDRRPAVPWHQAPMKMPS
jgi:hypothetical protein